MMRASFAKSYFRWLFCLVLVCQLTSVLRGAIIKKGSGVRVGSFHLEGRTLDVLKGLAEQSRTPIGVSGELIGADVRRIVIDEEHVSLGLILKEICKKDNRFGWRDMRDGSISVTVGSNRLDLVDVRVKTTIKNINTYEIADVIRQLPAVVKWSQARHCNVGQVIMTVIPMGGKPVEGHFVVHAENATLLSLLDQLSERRQTYFWSCTKFSEAPCNINLQP